ASGAGGGCRQWSADEFSLQACISNEGITAYGDMYIIKVPSDCLATTLEIRDLTNNVVASNSYGCALGHKGPITYPMDDGIHYFTRACIERINGVFCGTSWDGWY